MYLLLPRIWKIFTPRGSSINIHPPAIWLQYKILIIVYKFTPFQTFLGVNLSEIMHTYFKSSITFDQTARFKDGKGCAEGRLKLEVLMDADINKDDFNLLDTVDDDQHL